MRNSMWGLTKAVLVVILLLLSIPLISLAFDRGEVTRISVGELKKMMDDKTDVVILDTQPTSIYKKGHIKGASSFPWKENIALVETELLPRNRSIVLYCACGPGEGDSASVAAQLIDLGFDFDLVKVLKDPSIEGWKKAGYPME